MSIDDEQDVVTAMVTRAYDDGFDQGYIDALQAVTTEYQRMFNMDETQQARFRWVLSRVQEEAGITL